MEEKVLLNATVCLLVRDREVLLGLKIEKIGAGCWNGYGGGVEEGESILTTAARELKEETGGIVVLKEHLEKVAIIDFHNLKSDGESFVCRVHFFIAREWIGEAVETDEMALPTPFSIDRLPFDMMMPADKAFFPLILNGKKIIGQAKYGPFQKELLEPMVISEVDYLPND